MDRRFIALLVAVTLLLTLAWTTATPSEASVIVERVQFNNQPAPGAALEAALNLAPVVVRARVAQTTSFWSQDHSQILSRSQLDVHFVLRGQLDGAPIVNTVGGHLPGENLSMLTTDLPWLVEGEEVILFLTPAVTPGAGYQIVAGHDGKFTVQGGNVRYSGSAYTESLAGFYARLRQIDAAIALPADWQTLETAIAANAPVVAADYVYKGMKWYTNLVEFKVNLNSAQMGGEDGAPADFLQAIENAALTWSMVNEADFTLRYGGATSATSAAYNRSNDIFFEDRGLVDENGVRRPLAVATVFYSGGQILDADIWINDAYDWDTTGAPDRAEIDLESVVLHELGHWLALGHDPDSRAVMYYAITAGTLKRSLYETDRNGIIFIYPCTNQDGCAPQPTATTQPTATSTPLPTATATPTPSPTPSPTPLPAATSTPTASPAPTLTPASTVITADTGGELEFSLAANAQVNLVVPPGAVITDTILSVEKVTEPMTPPNVYQPVLDCFRVAIGTEGVSGATAMLSHPATLTIIYSAPAGWINTEALHLLAFDMQRAVWEELTFTVAPVTGETQRITVEIVQPATFGLFREDNKLYLPAVTR